MKFRHARGLPFFPVALEIPGSLHVAGVPESSQATERGMPVAHTPGLPGADGSEHARRRCGPAADTAQFLGHFVGVAVGFSSASWCFDLEASGPRNLSPMRRSLRMTCMVGRSCGLGSSQQQPRTWLTGLKAAIAICRWLYGYNRDMN